MLTLKNGTVKYSLPRMGRRLLLKAEFPLLLFRLLVKTDIVNHGDKIILQGRSDLLSWVGLTMKIRIHFANKFKTLFP